LINTVAKAAENTHCFVRQANVMNYDNEAGWRRWGVEFSTELASSDCSH